MVLSLIADGGATQLNRVGETIGGIGESIRENRLIKLARDDRQDALNTKRTEQRVKDQRSFDVESAVGASNIPDDRLPAYLQERRSQAAARGFDTSDIDNEIQRVSAGDIQGFRVDNQADIKTLEQLGLISALGGVPSDVTTFNTFAEGLSDEDRDKARRIELGLDPRAQGSSAITIATGGLTDQVANSNAAIEGAEQTETDRVSRLGNLVQRGTSAAESIGTLRRGIDLLKQVDTGGINAVALRAKQLFGVEGADEGELSANLGKAVLSQLRETFGAQFTQQEGDRLARIEAGFGKSNETNIRLLERALNTVDRIAKRGLKAAEELEDDFAIEDINSLLNTDNSDVSGGSSQVIQFDAQGNIIQ